MNQSPMSVKRTARAATRCVYSDLKSKAACVSQVGPRGGASTPVSYARVCALAVSGRPAAILAFYFR